MSFDYMIIEFKCTYCGSTKEVVVDFEDPNTGYVYCCSECGEYTSKEFDKRGYSNVDRLR